MGGCLATSMGGCLETVTRRGPCVEVTRRGPCVEVTRRGPAEGREVALRQAWEDALRLSQGGARPKAGRMPQIIIWEEAMASVSLFRVIEKMKLENATPEIDVKKIKVTQPDINRPALQIAGYFEHFDAVRLQVIGFVEYSYMGGLSEERKREVYDKLLSYETIPGVVFCRELQPDPIFLEYANKHKIPVLVTKKATSAFMAEIIRWLNVKLAPCISVHGVLVDVYGEGVLITGESGIGKSEAALELIKRGHRLVTDDVVELRKVSDDTLIGSAPDITKHFIELRGIGIVDVKALFGASSVKDTQSIDLVIRLEDWDKDKDYDRLGLEENYTEYLGNKVVCHNIPIRPGRNLAIICESAAVNHRQKKMGYNAAQELYARVQQSLAKRRDEDDEDFFEGGD